MLFLLFSFSLIFSIEYVIAQGNCVTPNRQSGNCIILNQCPEIYNAIVTQGKYLTQNQIQYFRESQCGRYNEQVLICCPIVTHSTQENQRRLLPSQQQTILPQQQNILPQQQNILQQQQNIEPQPQNIKPQQQNIQPQQQNIQPQQQNIQPQQQNIQPQQQNIQPEEQKIEPQQQNIEPQQQNIKPQPIGNDINSILFPKPGVCGKGAANKIIGGNETDIDEYPWMALLEYTQDGVVYGFHCGGSLINNRYVLTAAHCVKHAVVSNWLGMSVRLGEWDTQTVVDCRTDSSGYKDCSDPPINIPVESIIPHENYVKDSNNQHQDIALLRLAKTVQYTDFISPICLPSNNLRNSNLENFIFDVAGWGKTENHTNSNIKLKAAVAAVDLLTCNAIYVSRTAVSSLVSGQICAGGKQGVDSCTGDSGGPLIGLDTSNKKQIHYFLAGIVSFGPSPCGIKDWPGVYTRVGHYIDWLQKNMKT